MNKIHISFNITKKQIFAALTALVAFGALIRLISAYSGVHYFDIPYYLDWAKTSVSDGLFSIYEADLGYHNVDYPPLFLFPLYITGLILKNESFLNFAGYLMLALKMWQIIFDLATIVALYIVFKGKNKIAALGAAALWAVNPSIIFSSSYWGQTDSIMIFLLLVTFAAFDSKMPIAGTVLYAVACLTKFQCAYFAPVVLLFLLFGGYKPKKIVSALLIAAGVVLIVFAPFMMYSGITLPFRVYFGGFGKWPYASLYAFNFFGLLNLNYVSDSVQIAPFVSASAFGTFMTVIAVGTTVLIYFTSEKKCPYMLSFFIMNTIFMFASRMHDRYQIPVIIFLLLACVKHKNTKLFVCYVLTTVMTFLNAAVPFDIIVNGDSNPAPYMQYEQTVITALSAVNLLVYFITLYITLDFFFGITKKLKAAWSNPLPEKETL